MSIQENIYADKYINKLPYPTNSKEANYKELRTKYVEETRRLEGLFYNDICEDFGLDPNSAKSRKIYAKAYEDGHAYGYSEIYSHFQDLLDFVESLEEEK
jgi:hypothetical protein